MIKKIVMKVTYFIFPISEAKRAKKLIEEKKRCLENFEKCEGKVKRKVEKEINDLPQELQELIKLMEKEFERKKL